LTDAQTLRHDRGFNTSAHAADGVYTVSLEAPGVAASDVKIEVDASHITLRGVTKVADHGCCRLDYTLAIPQAYDAQAATAEVADELITIRCPKAAEPTTYRIVVSAAPEEPADPATDEERPYALTLIATGIAPADIELTAKGGALKVHGRSKRTGASLGPRVYKLPRNADATRIAACRRKSTACSR